MDADDNLHPDGPLMTMAHSLLNDGILALSMPGPTRDQTYYIADGNSVLLVQNTLFRVRALHDCPRPVPCQSCHVFLFSCTLGSQVYTHEGQVGF